MREEIDSGDLPLVVFSAPKQAADKLEKLVSLLKEPTWVLTHRGWRSRSFAAYRLAREGDVGPLTLVKNIDVALAAPRQAILQEDGGGNPAWVFANFSPQERTAADIHRMREDSFPIPWMIRDSTGSVLLTPSGEGGLVTTLVTREEVPEDPARWRWHVLRRASSVSRSDLPREWLEDLDQYLPASESKAASA